MANSTRRKPQSRRRGQAGEGVGVTLRIDLAGGVDDEVHRAADEDGVAGGSQLGNGGGPEVGQHEGHEVLEGELPAEDVGAIEEAACEERLQALHEASAGIAAGLAIGGQRLGAGERDRGLAVARALGAEIQHRTERGGLPALERKGRQPGGTPGVRERDGAVGRAEVESEHSDPLSAVRRQPSAPSRSSAADG